MAADGSNPSKGANPAAARWREAYTAQVKGDDERHNRSGIKLKPLYTSEDWSASDV